MKRIKNSRNFQQSNEITVLAQATIDLFPVVTCSRKTCQSGNQYLQPTLLVNGQERYYMHHMGTECVECPKLHEFWHLKLQALA